MSSRLQKLIAHYEAEKDSLIAERAERLEEWDYGMAHRFTKALVEVYEQLHILNNLADPLYDEKRHAADMLKWLEDRFDEDTELPRNYRQERLVEARARVAALQAQARPNAANAKSNHIGEALAMLLRGQITGFSLVINPQQRLTCNLRLVRRTLLVTVPEIRRHRAEYRIQKKQLRFLQSLGFLLYDQRDKLLLYTSFAVPEDVAKIKTLLARLVLDGFYYQEMVEHSYIRYWEMDPGF